MNAVVFCTTYLQQDPQRAQDWINYYTEFFKHWNIELVLVNDGPAEVKIDLKGARYLDFPEHLGRKNVWNFPGWKRSFWRGLSYARENAEYIAHIESDCWILPSGQQPFVDKLFSRGYYTGFTSHYNFPEAALQVLNDESVVNYFIDKYSCELNYAEEIDFELHLKEGLNPVYIMLGERNEGVRERYRKEHNFISGCDFGLFRELTNAS